MAYTINVVSSGSYNITAHVASENGGGTFHLEFGPVGQIGGSGVTTSPEFNVPNTQEAGAVARIGTLRSAVYPLKQACNGFAWSKTAVLEVG
jgi:hypothetical protein